MRIVQSEFVLDLSYLALNPSLSYVQAGTNRPQCYRAQLEDCRAQRKTRGSCQGQDLTQAGVKAKTASSKVVLGVISYSLKSQPLGGRGRAVSGSSRPV